MGECGFCENTKCNLYTCPRCNLNYCSVRCYQSPTHSKCSEQFYRNCVEEEIRVNDSRSLNLENQESKKHALAALQRLREEDENSQEVLNEVLDSDDEEDVSHRFDGIDLDDSNKVWEHLLESEKQEFQKMIQTGEIEKIVPKFIPWWDQNFNESNVLIENVENDSNVLKTEVFMKNLKEVIPKVDIGKILKISTLLGSTKPAINIKFNLINVLYAYAYSVKYFRGEHKKYYDSFTEMCYLLSGNLRDGQTFESADMAIESAALSVNQHSMISVSQEFTKSTKHDVMKIIKGPCDLNKCDSTLLNIFLLAAINDMKSVLSFCLSQNSGSKKSETNDRNKRKSGREEHSGLPGWLLDEGLFSKNRDVKHDRTLLKKSIKKLEFYMSWILECYNEFVVNDH